MNIKLEHTLSVAHYNALRHAVGWSVLEERQAARGLKNSYYVVVAQDGDKVVGMARVISDGGYVALISDVIVRPEYQGYGIASMMLEDILRFIEVELAGNSQMVMVNLVAAKGKEALYKKFGFIERPNEDAGAGMTLYFNK